MALDRYAREPSHNVGGGAFHSNDSCIVQPFVSISTALVWFGSLCLAGHTNEITDKTITANNYGFAHEWTFGIDLYFSFSLFCFFFFYLIRECNEQFEIHRYFFR